MTLTPEPKQAVEKAGDESVRVEDPESNTAYLIVREEVFRRMCAGRHRPFGSIALRIR